MTQVMKGIRVVEVAKFSFVPAAGAVLADWGADVIKIEHPGRGDTQRAFLNVTGVPADPNRHILMEHPNRGKRSVGIDLSTAEGQALLYEIVKTANVFLTNYLPLPGASSASTPTIFALPIRTSSMRADRPSATRDRNGKSAGSTARLSGRGAAWASPARQRNWTG